MFKLSDENTISDPSSEGSLLALLILESEELEQLRVLLSVDDFFIPMHKKIFTMIDQMTGLTKIKEISGSDFLRKASFLNREAFLTFLKKSQQSEANFIEMYPDLSEQYLNELFIHRLANSQIPFLIDKLHEKRRIRKILSQIQLWNNEITKTKFLKKTSNEIIYDLNTKLSEIYEGVSMYDFDHIEKVSADYLNFFKSRKGSGQLPGISSGFRSLDALTDGWQPGQLVILAARPSMGKTAFAISLALNAAKEKQNKKVLFFSLEMENSQIVERMFANQAKIDGSLLKKPEFISETQQSAIYFAQSELASYNISFSHSSERNLYRIINKVKKENTKEKVDLVIIDYLQLITLDNRQLDNNPTLAVTQISNQLKSLARELGIPVIALAQLSRSVEARQDKRPILSDLRDSGSIEQDADIVMFLYRDDYYNRPADNRTHDISAVEVRVAKNRQGSIGTTTLSFMLARNIFLEAPNQQKLGGNK